MQRAAESSHVNHYDLLLAEAIKVGKMHETKAKHFVPKMYNALVNEEGLEPSDAADRIYKDLVGIWQKDTIRRLLPVESKNQVARHMQALSRFPLESKAGSILQQSKEGEEVSSHHENDSRIATLEQENAALKKSVQELENAKRLLLERTLALEKMLKESQRDNTIRQENSEKVATTIILPPHLFMKAYTLMRGSSKPLVLRVSAREAIDIDRMKA